MSFRKINGTSLIKTSLKTPPNVPVMAPIIIQTQKDSPASRLTLMPTIVNSPRPMASKRNNVLPHLKILPLNSIVTSSATPVVMKYIELSIQNGVISNNKSLVVPPPIAVTNPTMYAPNQSIFLPDANRIPLIANANVPIKSKTVVKFNSERIVIIAFDVEDAGLFFWRNIFSVVEIPALTIPQQYMFFCKN